MKRNSLLYTSLGLFLLTALLHIFAIAFSVYWTLVWFDSVVHGFGGMALGFFALWLGTPSRETYVSPFSFQMFFLVLGGTLCVGLLWEFFEYSAGITSLLSRNYVPDTLGDLAMDVVGGLAALVYTSITRKAIFS
ncbi:MAG: hypothetical protein PHV93_01340 [Candidatus Pacebacteria bacterium]|nr:hypothetical protein [Candidatus Paceibacterota bacterium]